MLQMCSDDSSLHLANLIFVILNLYILSLKFEFGILLRLKNLASKRLTYQMCFFDDKSQMRLKVISNPNKNPRCKIERLMKMSRFCRSRNQTQYVIFVNQTCLGIEATIHITRMGLRLDFVVTRDAKPHISFYKEVTLHLCNPHRRHVC